MPDYYSSLASHYLNIWVDFESYEQPNVTSLSKSEFVDSMRHRVCLIIIRYLLIIINLYFNLITYLVR